MIDLAALVLVAWTPIAALVWLGLRNERIRSERLLRESVRALNIVRTSRGR